MPLAELSCTLGYSHKLPSTRRVRALLSGRRAAVPFGVCGNRRRCEISPETPLPYDTIPHPPYLIAGDVRIRQLSQLALERGNLLFRTTGDVLKATRNLASEDPRKRFRQPCFWNSAQSTRLRSNLAYEVLSRTLGEQPFHRRQRLRPTPKERNSILAVDRLPSASSSRSQRLLG